MLRATRRILSKLADHNEGFDDSEEKQDLVDDYGEAEADGGWNAGRRAVIKPSH